MDERERIAMAMAQQRPADPLRSLRDMIPENKSGGLSMLNMIRSALGTSANWLDGTQDPSAVRVGPDTIAPLGLAGFGMGAVPKAAVARAMADNARSSTPGTVVNSLDMSEAARMQRAREMGFDTETPWYHGTTYADEINRDGFKKGWTHFSDSRAIADSYQGWPKGSSPGTIETRLKVQNPAYYDAKGQKYTDIANKVYGASWDAEKAGHDALVIRNIRDHFDSSVPVEPHTTTVMFNQAGIRSPQAAFDPAKRDSALLLAADNAKGSAPGTVVNGIAEGAGSRGRAVADELLGIGMDANRFRSTFEALKADKTLTKADWDDLANHFQGGTHRFKFKTLDEAKNFVWKQYVARHSSEVRQKRAQDLYTMPDDVKSSPYASAPGLAANSTQQQVGGGVGDFLYRNFVDATVPLSSDENEWAQEIMGSRQLAREDRLRAADDIGKSANEALERFSGYLPHTQIRRGMKSLFEKHGTGGPIEPITPPSNSTQQHTDAEKKRRLLDALMRGAQDG